MLKEGDVVVHKDRYWGEPAYKITKIDEREVSVIWTGSKFGPPWRGSYTTSRTRWDETAYCKCPAYLRVWLWFLGNLYSDVSI